MTLVFVGASSLALSLAALAIALHSYGKARRWARQWHKVGEVRHLPGQGPALYMAGGELPPVGTSLYVRHIDKQV